MGLEKTDKDFDEGFHDWMSSAIEHEILTRQGKPIPKKLQRRTDRYYTLQGGQYGDTGGWGCPGYELGAKLIENMKYWEQCRYLEDTIESVEERGFYLTPSWRQYDRIYLTKRWMTEFYNRHKDEPLGNWRNKYDAYLNKIQKGSL